MSQDELLNHEYDGIREYDNPTPAWWSWIFFGSFVFSVCYLLHYKIGHGHSIEEAYALEMVPIEARRKEEALAAARSVNADALGALMADVNAVAGGESVYKKNCMACHGAAGEGGIGPNLTDQYWLHGNGSLPAIHKVVYDGVVEKGMVAWGRMLPPEELNQVVAFVGTLRGKNLPGKEPQGEKVDL